MRKKMWRCKSCGRVCDGSNTVCPDCGLDLGFYGEIQFVETGEPEPSSPSISQPQEQAEPAAQEESRQEIKKERKAKESKPEKGGKQGNLPIVAGVIFVVLLIVSLTLEHNIFLIANGMPARNLGFIMRGILFGRFLKHFQYGGWAFDFFFRKSFSYLLEVAVCIYLVAVLVRVAKRSKAKTEGKPGIAFISTGVVMLALLALERIMYKFISRLIIRAAWIYKYFLSPISFWLELLVCIYLLVVLIIMLVKAAKRR